MIEIELIPDGAAEMPVEARDHQILWDHLQTASASSASAHGPADVERVVQNDRVRLRLPGSLGEHSSTTMDNIVSAITTNISGIKQHPDGWKEVQ